MRQVIKVVCAGDHTDEDMAESNILTVWESLCTPDGVKPGLVNMWPLGNGQLAILFDYTLDGGATVLEPAPVSLNPKGGSLPAHGVLGRATDDYVIAHDPNGCDSDNCPCWGAGWRARDERTP